jgi:heme exporter protein A
MPSDIPPPAKPALELQNVSKFFGDVAAVRAVQVRIDPGDSVLLYGPNGAGKTTLLRLLATLARPSEGHALFYGQDIHRDPVPAKRAIGFVSHATFLYGELTARENLKFVAALYGLDDVEKTISGALELFGLQDRAGVPVRELSRGLQQRVALARALLHDPRFLLLDEPFTGLDAVMTARLGDLLRKFPQQGKALVFSTHDFEQGAMIAERLVALVGGRVRYDGPLRQAPFRELGIERKM